MSRGAALVLAVACLASCADEAPAARTSRAQVTRGSEVLLEVSIDLAITAQERMTGLRGRSSLADDQGLALLFAVEDEICLVNDGVPFSIDALYADDEGIIGAVATLAANDATPVCHPATRNVLELAAGVADEVAIGDRLTITP